MISGSSTRIQQSALKREASFLQESILNFLEEADPLPWPPTVESLVSRERQYPELLQLFFKELLSFKGSHHVTAERVDRLTDSFCQDVIHAVSKGKFLTPKHASLGLDLHSMTGQKLPITILARLGHCITYDAINEIETAQAELVEHFQSMGLNLPLQPAAIGSKVSTIFWWDNFDRNVETASGAGSIHNTPGIAFQEHSDAAVMRQDDISIPRSKRRSIQLPKETVDKRVAVNPKAEPPSLAKIQSRPAPTSAQMYCSKLLQIWKSVRYLNSANQTPVGSWRSYPTCPTLTSPSMRELQSRPFMWFGTIQLRGPT
ncbi:Hypothetical predicted protein [Paramuricea clavata]|uniref:Uncharacterized protein n=1 Tax=Paramuricea clavata TaxID=317549 RepID=A0A6S7GHV3_PARCT|nr:Hypothetical predicted protein [Paramuricea clavata]